MNVMGYFMSFLAVLRMNVNYINIIPVSIKLFHDTVNKLSQASVRTQLPGHTVIPFVHSPKASKPGDEINLPKYNVALPGSRNWHAAVQLASEAVVSTSVTSSHVVIHLQLVLCHAVHH